MPGVMSPPLLSAFLTCATGYHYVAIGFKHDYCNYHYGVVQITAALFNDVPGQVHWVGMGRGGKVEVTGRKGLGNGVGAGRGGLRAW